MTPGPRRETAGGRFAARLALALLGGFWVLRGVEGLLLPQATAATLVQVFPGLPRGGASALARAAGLLQMAAGAGLAFPRARATASALGAAVTGTMLVTVALGFERLRGADCGCLRLLAIPAFGWPNVAVLAVSVAGFALAARFDGEREATAAAASSSS